MKTAAIVHGCVIQLYREVSVVLKLWSFIVTLDPSRMWWPCCGAYGLQKIVTERQIMQAGISCLSASFRMSMLCVFVCTTRISLRLCVRVRVCARVVCNDIK